MEDLTFEKLQETVNKLLRSRKVYHVSHELKKQIDHSGINIGGIEIKESSLFPFQIGDRIYHGWIFYEPITVPFPG